MFDDTADEVYCYNPKEKTVIGIWDACQGPDEGWYVDVYQLTEYGWENVDGAMFTIERDDNGNIIEGYKSAMECYEQVYRQDDDIFCDEMVFIMASDLEYENFKDKRRKEQIMEMFE